MQSSQRAPAKGGAQSLQAASARLQVAVRLAQAARHELADCASAGRPVASTTATTSTAAIAIDTTCCMLD